MTELPKDCPLPVGVEWCGWHCEDTPWFAVHERQEIWAGLSSEDRRFVAARCAMWWEERAKQGGIDWADDLLAADAWRKLWRELEGKA